MQAIKLCVQRQILSFRRIGIALVNAAYFKTFEWMKKLSTTFIKRVRKNNAIERIIGYFPSKGENPLSKILYSSMCINMQ